MKKCKQYGGSNYTDFFAGALRAPVQIIFRANSEKLGLPKKFKQHDGANSAKFFACALRAPAQIIFRANSDECPTKQKCKQLVCANCKPMWLMKKCKQYDGANNTDFFASALRAPV